MNDEACVLPIKGTSHPGRTSLQKVKRPKSVGMKMVSNFLSTSGHLAAVALENHSTVNAQPVVVQSI